MQLFRLLPLGHSMLLIVRDTIQTVNNYELAEYFITKQVKTYNIYYIKIIGYF